MWKDVPFRTLWPNRDPHSMNTSFYNTSENEVPQILPQRFGEQVARNEALLKLLKAKPGLVQVSSDKSLRGLKYLLWLHIRCMMFFLYFIKDYKTCLTPTT